MKFREIAQHNHASLFIIIILLILDLLAFTIIYNLAFDHQLKLAIQNFSDEIIIEQTCNLYFNI